MRQKQLNLINSIILKIYTTPLHDFHLYALPAPSKLMLELTGTNSQSETNTAQLTDY